MQADHGFLLVADRWWHWHMC